MLRPLKTFSRRVYRKLRPHKPQRYVSFELVGPCNLHCSYCLRSESMLYGKASFLPREGVRQILAGLRSDWGDFSLTLTGGEPTLHPEFAGIVDDAAALGLRYKVVTNGWHFDRVLDSLLRTRDRLISVSFSLDGATREAHDAWRGKGSFDRLMKGITSAKHHRLPFQINVVLRKDTRPQMEAIALLGARLGAKGVNFGAMLPTSTGDFGRHALSAAEEKDAEREGLELSQVFKMPVRVPFVLYRPQKGAHCYPLAGKAVNIDHQGRLTLCANLSFFRGSLRADEVAGEAGPQPKELLTRLGEIQRQALAARDNELAACAAAGSAPGPFLSSPCLTCLKRFDKAPWSRELRT
ncbi:MAG: radical SAM protein [Vicinamibacteria bacterium]|nr:radical SAM protein [Vicinamibacteria bacterium]